MTALGEMIIWFAAYGFGGWAFECVYYSLLEQKLVNSGFLRGPCCPVYGLGAVAVILSLRSVDHPAAIFCLSILIAGSIEYLVGWLLETLFHARWWDYRDMPFNIRGRVFPLSLLSFGIMSLIALKCVQPALGAFTAGLSPQVRGFLAGLICAALAIDTCATVARLVGVRPSAQKLNERYQALLGRCPALRKAKGVIEKVVWGGRPVKHHGGPFLRDTKQD